MLSSSGGSREGISPALLSSFIATGSFTLHILEFYLFKLECIYFRILNQRQTSKSLKVMHYMLRCTDAHICKHASAGICATMQVICCRFLALGRTGNRVQSTKVDLSHWKSKHAQRCKDYNQTKTWMTKHTWQNTNTHTREGAGGDF